VSSGGDERDQSTDDWFEEPAGEPGDAFRDPDAETWLEDEAEGYAGPRDRRPLIAALAAAVALILAGVGIARVIGDDDGDGGVFPTEPATTSATETTGTDTGETATTSTTPAITVPTDVTLQSGDDGGNVELLQQGLAALGYEVGTPDGVFGPGTEEAVKQFQADTGLDADGVAGPATLSALNEALASAG
jgi:Putative peptidoglycan binding domain